MRWRCGRTIFTKSSDKAASDKAVSDKAVSDETARLFCMVFQLAIEEVGAERVGGDPVAPEQEAVDFVGEDVLLEGRALSAKSCGEADGVGELHVAVVVALDQQDGRTPGLYRRHRGRFKGDAGGVLIGVGVVL